MSKSMKRITWLLFIIYCVVMIYLLFDRTRAGMSEMNLVPFKTIGEFWTVMVQSQGVEGAEMLFISSLANLGGNVVLFIPLGFFPPLLWIAKRRFWSDMGLCALIIIAVELIQYVSGLGSADIDDLILNMAGAAMGYGAFALLRKKLKL